MNDSLYKRTFGLYDSLEQMNRVIERSNPLLSNSGWKAISRISDLPGQELRNKLVELNSPIVAAWNQSQVAFDNLNHFNATNRLLDQVNEMYRNPTVEAFQANPVMNATQALRALDKSLYEDRFNRFGLDRLLGVNSALEAFQEVSNNLERLRPFTSTLDRILGDISNAVQFDLDQLDEDENWDDAEEIEFELRATKNFLDAVADNSQAVLTRGQAVIKALYKSKLTRSVTKALLGVLLDEIIRLYVVTPLEDRFLLESDNSRIEIPYSNYSNDQYSGYSLSVAKEHIPVYSSNEDCDSVQDFIESNCLIWLLRRTDGWSLVQYADGMGRLKSGYIQN